MSNEREGGYYWCRKESNWDICYWSENCSVWLVTANGQAFSNDYWDEICECRLEAPVDDQP